jgi:hypothetical protein
MALFRIHAMPCKFERSKDWVGRSHNLLGQPILSEMVECRTVADLDRAMADMKDRAAQAHPTSFFVSAMILRGQRAPAGYRQRTFLIECDRDTVS